MYKTYKVCFIDASDDCYNEKILCAKYIEDIYECMHTFGHYILEVFALE